MSSTLTRSAAATTPLPLPDTASSGCARDMDVPQPWPDPESIFAPWETWGLEAVSFHYCKKYLYGMF